MKTNVMGAKKICAFLIVLSLVLSGCGQGSKKPSPQLQSATGDQQSDKIPSQLTAIEGGIEKIIKTLNGPSVSANEEDQKKGSQEGDSGQESQSVQGKEGEGNGEESKGGEGKEGEKDGQQSEGGKNKKQAKPSEQPKQQDPFEKVTSQINDLHFQWNSYMPLAVKSGANNALIDSFSNDLNGLTGTVGSKNPTSTMLAASNLYAHIPDFYNLYKAKTSPEIKRIRHFTRSSMLNSMVGNWPQASAEIASLKSSWSIFKNIIPKDQQEDSSRLDFSITELEKVVKDKNESLTNIKGRVALSNVESLEKAMEKSNK